MNKKFTYKEIGPASWYQYELSDRNTPKTFIVSDNLTTLNVVNGEDNGIKQMITDVDNIGEEITELESKCFKGCPNLTSINLPTTLQIINDEAFKECYKLSSFKDDVFNMPMYMGDSVFENCDFRKINIKSDISGYDNTMMEINSRIFANNKKLTNVNMDNIIIGENMFENCSSLSNITFSNNSYPIYTKKEGFKKCDNLLSLTIPNVSSYYDLNDLFLKGSNVQSVILNNMDSAECDFAIGKKTINIIKEEENPTSIIPGNVYFFQADPTKQDEINEQLSKSFASAIKKHIPIILVECNDGCSLCSRFQKNTLKNSEFREWLKTQKFSVFYISKYNNKLNVNIDGQYEFVYTDRFGKTSQYKLNNNKKIDLLNRINTSNYKHIIIDYKIKTEGDNIFVYKLLDEYNEKVKKEEDFFNDNYYVDDTLSFNNAFTKYGIEGNSLSYPLFGCYHRDNNDETVCSGYKKLSESQKKKFLNGESFNIYYTSIATIYNKSYKNSTLRTCSHTVKFYSSNEGSQDFKIIINDKIYKYTIDSIYDVVSFDGHPMSGHLKNHKPNIYIDSNNIYINLRGYSEGIYVGNFGNGCNFGVAANNGTLLYGSVKETTKEFERLANAYFNMDKVHIGEEQIYNLQTEEYVGKCWGVEHNCDVIDKDGKVHKYKYNPPKT